MCPTVNDDPHLAQLEADLHQLRAELAASESARRSAERQLADTQAMGRIGNFEWDIATDTLRWSPELYRIYGIEGRRIACMSDYMNQLDPAGQDRLTRSIERLLTDHGPLVNDYAFTRPDGVTRQLVARMRIVLDAHGAPSTLLGVMQDVTERHEIETRLRERERELRAIVEHTPEIITIRDREGRYLMANRATYRICREVDDLVGRTDAEVFGAETATTIRETDMRVITTGQPLVYELPLLSQDDRLLGTFEITKHPFQGPDGQCLGVISIARDISARAEAAEMQRAQIARLQDLDRLKSGFVGTVSHELRTPLTSILGYAEFLADGVGGELNEHQAGFVGQIELAARRLGAVVDDLLDFARLDAGTFKLHMAPSDLGAKVREVIEAFGPQLVEAGQTLDAQLPPGPLEADADPQRVAQVLTNLLGNAIKFTPPGGIVRVRLSADDARLRVEVSDAGPGISEEDVAKLFVRFGRLDNEATRSTSGTGLGLSISKVIVEGHGGTIGVTSRLGEGATFWFELPRHQPLYDAF